MFVFPAFDSNYKTRKRTFKCCQNCRVKRVKCEIISTDYELVGCSNCRKHNWSCDLVKVDNFGSSESAPISTRHVVDLRSDKPQKDQIFESTLNSNETLKNQQRESIDSDSQLDTFDMKTVTAQYLKLKFNFNISGHESAITYQYVYQGHPKVIIANPSEDRSIWHESGVIVDFKTESDNNENLYKPYKVRGVGNSGSEKLFHMKNPKVYQFLLSINAFTLSTPEYPFDSSEIRELINLYFYKINSIFPVVHEKSFWGDFKADKVQTILVYAIVLIISRDKLAKPILRNVFMRGRRQEERMMSDAGFQEEYVTFMTDLDCKIRQVLYILPQLGDNDKLIRLVVSLLLTLHFNFDKLGNEQSSHDLTNSINLASSLGIHMKGSDKTMSKEKIEYSTNLWWLCYVFDRFNALVNSRQIYIRQEDFNVDLPYNNLTLLKLVQLGRSLENMMFAIYQPFNNSIINKNVNSRYKKFNTDEFQRIEFELCSKEKYSNRNIYESGISSRITDSKIPLNDYVGNTIHFLSRLVNNLIIVTSQKAKYDDHQIPNHIPESIACHASSNILWYILEMQDEYIMNIPLLPWCLSIAMAVALKKKAKSLLRNGASSIESDTDTCFQWEDYITELEKLAGTWWVVDEICKLSRDFTNKLAANAERKLNKKRIHSSNSTVSKRVRNNSSSLDTRSTPKENSKQSPNATSIPSIKNILHSNNNAQSSPDYFKMYTSDYQNNFTDDGQSSRSNSVDSSNLKNQYDEYLDSMQLDIFDNDFFKDVPNVINFLN